MNHEYFLIRKAKSGQYVVSDKATCKGLKDAEKWFSNVINENPQDRYIIVKSERWLN